MVKLPRKATVNEEKSVFSDVKSFRNGRDTQEIREPPKGTRESAIPSLQTSACDAQQQLR